MGMCSGGEDDAREGIATYALADAAVALHHELVKRLVQRLAHERNAHLPAVARPRVQLVALDLGRRAAPVLRRHVRLSQRGSVESAARVRNRTRQSRRSKTQVMQATYGFRSSVDVSTPCIARTYSPAPPSAQPFPSYTRHGRSPRDDIHSRHAASPAAPQGNAPSRASRTSDKTTQHPGQGPPSVSSVQRRSQRVRRRNEPCASASSAQTCTP